MEIGSIYEIDPGTIPAEEKAPKGKSAPETEISLEEIGKYGKSNVRFTASGRAAIALALQSFAKIRPEAGKIGLLPAYMCNTVYFPFQWEGWEIRFYHIHKNLEADREELCCLMEKERPDLLFIHPYYGVDTWRPMRSLLKEWKAEGTCIMEDVTQSYYLEDAGKEADYVVGSLRKWYPLPDGGFVASKEPLAGKEMAWEKEFTRKRLELLTKKWEYLHGQGSVEGKKAMKADYLRKNREMEAWLDGHREVVALSGVSAGILAAADEKGCRKRRNENYRYLCRKLGERREGKSCFWPVFPSAGNGEAEGAAPLYFPVYALDRDGLQGFLAKHDIYAPVLWPKGKETENCLTEEERFIYGHVLALPMDQRYGLEEMGRMAEVLDRYEGRKG